MVKEVKSLLERTSPRGQHRREGTINVPPSVNRHNGEVEDKYRELLWPKLRPGNKRFSRKLVWVSKSTLHYVILDVPDVPPSSKRAAEKKKQKR